MPVGFLWGDYKQVSSFLCLRKKELGLLTYLIKLTFA